LLPILLLSVNWNAKKYLTPLRLSRLHVKPHLTGGKNNVIDEAFKGAIQYKDTKEGGIQGKTALFYLF
jgi:hypothetical protein